MLEGIQRWHVVSGWLCPDDAPDEQGRYVTYADVADAWAAKLASIRAAVEVERAGWQAWGQEWGRCPTGGPGIVKATVFVNNARASLDALMAVAP